MPRRKKLDELNADPTPHIAESPTPEPAKKRTPRKKVEAPVTDVAPVEPAAEPAKPKTRKKAEPAEPIAPATVGSPAVRAPRTRAAAKPKAAPVLPPAQAKGTVKTLDELVEESGEDLAKVKVPKLPTKRTPPKPKAVSTEPVELPEIENPPLLSWRLPSEAPARPERTERPPRPDRRRPEVTVPHEEPVAVAPREKVEDLTDYSALAAEFDAPVVEWRAGAPSGTAPTKVRADHRGREKREHPTAPKAKKELPPLEPLPEADDLPIVEFRTRDGAAKAPERERSAETEEPRNRRSRRGRRDTSETSESPVEPVVAEPKAVPVVAVPVPPAPKPLIPTPNDAPQVVMRNGLPTLVRNGQVYPPMAVFGNTRDGQRMQNVLEEMQMAGQAGIHLFVHQLALTVDPAQTAEAIARAQELLEQCVKLDRECQVLFRIVFSAPFGWADKYANARYNNRQGKLAEPSVCDDEYWAIAGECLAKFVSEMRKHPKRDQILGVHLDRSGWFYSATEGYDLSKAAIAKFRDWARARYRNDVVSLRAAWFDGNVSFDTLRVPDQPRENEAELEDKFVRANRKERKWVDYHLMLSDQTEALIGDLAYTAKEASDGYFLVGTNYGYTFEWQHPGSGHLGLGKLLRCPEIDFVAGPPSYKNREPGGAASFPGPIDSFLLNGKLYLSEEDFKTSLGVGYDPDEHNPTIKTPQALESVHWRGVGAALAHGSGVSWMDSFGNGWLKTASVWNRAKVVRESLVRRMATTPSDPDVAVFIDERALAYLVDQKGFALLVQNVRESIMRAGMSAGFYLLSDLQHRERFPESKLYLFLNGWDIRSELRAAIKHRLQRDNKLLFWLYSAALFDNGRESLERAREVTGIALKPQPFHSRTGTTILSRRHPLCEAFREKTAIGGARLEPSYFAIPEDGLVLGEYTATGLPSFVYREMKHETDPAENWQAVFLGEPIVTPDLLRALGQMAGAHVWSFTEDVVHVRAPFLTVHCTGAGMRTIALPGKWCAYNLIEQEWVQTESASMRFHATDGSTHCFLVGTREEVENILSVDPAGLLKMDELPARGENTIREDAFSFDVPMMKLGEFMDSGETDELTDDLLFKPALLEGDSLTDESDNEPEKVGRRRRKRTPSRENRGRRDSYSNELDLGVVFRKRD